MPWIKTLKFKKSEPKKSEASEPSAETKPAQTVEPSTQQSTSPTPSEVEPLAELQPLISQWSKACMENAQAGFVNFILLRQDNDVHAYYILNRTLKTNGDVLTLLRDDLTVWQCERDVALTPYGYVGNVKLQWKKLAKPQEYGITPENVVSIVKRVIGGETL
ncbi:MAG: hypothetical protein QXX59_08935 [Candidatus Bathyarchaeia archaeon]